MAMGAALTLVRQVQVTMMVSIALCALAGETLFRRPPHDPPDTLFHALSLVSITVVGATMVVRRTLVLPSEAPLRGRFDDRVAVSRWRTSYLFLYALCELPGIFGLILRMAGFTLANVWGFYLGGFVLLLLYSPRAPRS
ncbi:MAG: hypothetical protein ABSG02_07270 [Terriglobales bacterium]|jgi:hypothetical protein